MGILTPNQIYVWGLPLGKDDKKQKRGNVEIKPDYFYSPREVAAILSVSYYTALRIMGRMKHTADFAKPRAKKRLLRVKGSDLREYLNGKVSC